MTSHTSPLPSNSNKGPRAWESIAVTSAEAALVGALVISRKFWKRRRLLFGAVFLHRQFHRTLNGQLNHPGFLIDPSIAGNLPDLVLPDIGEGLAPRVRTGAPLQFLGKVFRRRIEGRRHRRMIEITNHEQKRRENREEKHDGEERDRPGRRGGNITHDG